MTRHYRNISDGMRRLSHARRSLQQSYLCEGETQQVEIVPASTWLTFAAGLCCCLCRARSGHQLAPVGTNTTAAVVASTPAGMIFFGTACAASRFASTTVACQRRAHWAGFTVRSVIGTRACKHRACSADFTVRLAIGTLVWSRTLINYCVLWGGEDVCFRAARKAILFFVYLGAPMKPSNPRPRQNKL